MIDQPTLTGLRVPGGRKPRPEASRRPARRRYQYGAEAERRARDKLTRMGYHVVRSAQSRGAADLVAIGHRDVLLVQVRSGVNAPGPGERQAALDALAAIPTPAGATVRRELWFWDTLETCWVRTALCDAPGAGVRREVSGIGSEYPRRSGGP